MHALGGKQDQLLFSLLFHPPLNFSDGSRRKVWLLFRGFQGLSKP